MSTVVITNCTNRKRHGGQPPLELCTSGSQSLLAVTANWAQRIMTNVATRPAETLYTGRSVQDAKWVAQKLGAELMFASTGLGLISGEQPCPLYNLTVAAESNSIRPWLESLDLHPSDWWDAINDHWRRPYPIASLAQRSDIRHILIALSASYIDLITNDLIQIEPNNRPKLRLFTSRPGIQRLPEEFHYLAMPYDERLESSRLAGTRVDFPQRSMRHFVEFLEAPTYSANTDHEKVSNAMSGLAPVDTIKRRRASDEEVKSLLMAAWENHKGSSTRLLRYLRDDALVACEQSRFRGLWLELQQRNAQQSMA